MKLELSGILRTLERLLSAAEEVHYISGESLPAPLSRAEEAEALARLERGDEAARAELIEHNLRLVVYIARRFENSGVGLDDLTDDQKRQTLLLLVRRSGLTHDFYDELGAIFDIDVDTGAYDPFRVTSRVDSPIWGTDWAHAYVIVVRTSLTSSKNLFRTTSRADERLASWGISFLECLVRKNAPAHAEVIFEYEE